MPNKRVQPQKYNNIKSHPISRKKVASLVDILAIQATKVLVQVFETAKRVKIRVEKLVGSCDRPDRGLEWGHYEGLEPAPKFTLSRRMLLHHFSHPCRRGLTPDMIGKRSQKLNCHPLRRPPVNSFSTSAYFPPSLCMLNYNHFDSPKPLDIDENELKMKLRPYGRNRWTCINWSRLFR